MLGTPMADLDFLQCVGIRKSKQLHFMFFCVLVVVVVVVDNDDDVIS